MCLAVAGGWLSSSSISCSAERQVKNGGDQPDHGHGGGGQQHQAQAQGFHAAASFAMT
jgi:hypothetical protein